MIRSFGWTLTAALTLQTLTPLMAQGRIVPPRPSPMPMEEPVRLTAVDADIVVDAGIARITLRQTFTNPGSRPAEGDYLFVLPGEAQVSDFKLSSENGNLTGRVLDAGAARRIYEEIVRSLRDPALLEFQDHGLFTARLFPIPPGGERELTLSYAQVLPLEGGQYRLVLPIRQSGQVEIERFHLTATLRHSGGVGTVYSPTHDLRVDRGGDGTVTVSVEANPVAGQTDLLLFHRPADRRGLDAGLLSYRPRNDRDGWFAFMATPAAEDRQWTAIPRDISFVLDVSGSMNGDKIRQAREALRYCLRTLSPADRFALTAFSSTVTSFADTLRPVDVESVANAEAFIDGLDASGGTNIEAALSAALGGLRLGPERLSSIVFLTDGLPTEGETDIATLLNTLTKANPGGVRIFTFGVGYDVNTWLLDRLAGDSRGSANYVRPEEDIETSVSAFFAKIGNPFLADPRVDFGRLAVYDVFPVALPDLYAGQRVLVLGRYRAPGSGPVALSGRRGDRAARWDCPVTLAEREGENDFIAILWANRKVAHLLDQIRRNGESDELVTAVRELGIEYGIVTPYTSYLIEEQEREERQARVQQRTAGSGTRSLMRGGDTAMDEEVRAMGSAGAAAASAAPQAASGKQSVLYSRARKKLAEVDVSDRVLQVVQRIEGRRFQLRNGVWVEAGLEDRKADRRIAFLGAEYFALSQEPDMGAILALGDRVRFRLDGDVMEVVAAD